MSKNHDFLFRKFQPDPVADEEFKLAELRERDERLAKAQAFHASAYREMPEDLRTQAVAWGVSALMEAVWMNAWERGYKQSIRDRSALQEKEAGE